MKSPGRHEYTFDRQESKKKSAYDSLVVVFPENGTLRPPEQVPGISMFYQILSGNKQSIKGWKRLPAKKNETPYEKIVIWEGIDVDSEHQGDATVKPKRQKRRREQ